MSIIPYNNQILYHDPHDGILVLSNNREVIVSVTPDATEAHRSLVPQTNTHKCPNCGFAWTQYERRSSASFQFQSFMHHDYFKLLARLPSPDEAVPSTIPQELFNQGYFKRFFKKIAPYTLGAGAHAQVYKVAHVLNDIQLGTYAVKRILIGDKLERLEQVLNEVLILYELSARGASQNLIRYNHVWLEVGPLDDSRTFILSDTPDTPQKVLVPYVYILQQYCGGGNLEELINGLSLDSHMSWKERILHERKRRQGSAKKTPWLTRFEVWKLFKDVVQGVSFLHANGILHRDLKPSNCLLDAECTPGHSQSYAASSREMPTVLVSDFGEGKFLNKRHRELNRERQGNTGTLEFTAPELWVYSGSVFANDFTFESDVYSLGLILCFLCVGKLPFSDLVDEHDPQASRARIMDWYFGLTRDSFGRWWNTMFTREMDCFEDLIYGMVKGDSVRMRAEQVLEYLDNMEREEMEEKEEEKDEMRSVEEDRVSVYYSPFLLCVPFVALEFRNPTRLVLLSKAVLIAAFFFAYSRKGTSRVVVSSAVCFIFAAMWGALPGRL